MCNKMPATKINPFLKLFLAFYGNTSIQLLPVRPRENFSSLLNLLWNMLLIAAGSYRIYRFTYYSSKSTKNPAMVRIFKENPLLALLFDVANEYLYQIAYLLNSIYFIVISCRKKGVKIADLLNSCFTRLPRFQSKSTSRKIFFSFLVAHQVTFLLTIFWTITHVVQERPLWYVHLSLEWAQFYILNTNTYISCIITHFYKYCMVESLKLILKNYEREKDIRKLEVELKRLATLNSQLNEVLSFPMIVFIVPYVAEVLITFSLAWLIKLAHVDTYLLQFALHIFTLAYCEVAVQNQLTKIFSIISNHHKKVSNCDTNLRRSEMNMMTPIRNFELMSLYRDRFQLRLFSLVSINWAFIFALALFVLNYVIFIMQTSF